MRVRAVLTTPEFLISLCIVGPMRHLEVVANALPPDARLIRVGIDRDGYLRLIVESATFDEVPESEPIPDHPHPRLRVVYQGEPCNTP